MEFDHVDPSCTISSPERVEHLISDNHFAKFIVDIVSLFDLSMITSQYLGRGKEPYPPAMLLSLLIFSYAAGETLCRAMYRNTYNFPAYMFICSNKHPHHTTISVFLARFCDEIEELFSQVVVIAASFGLLIESDFCYIEGIKFKANVKANASK
jgi:transposase